jgi:hypothetical protein
MGYPAAATLIGGVIEGFYGPPWRHEARLRCIDHLADWGLSHYVWAAKDEPRHRQRWDEPFTEGELVGLAELARRREQVALGVALTPGSGAEASTVADKLGQAVSAGATVVVLSFDDLPALDAATHHRQLALEVRDRIGVPVWVVPTHYAGVEGSPYLDALCDGLPDDVLLMWTGPTVVADRIDAHHARARRSACGGRAPLLWDNVPVNDGPMSDRLHVGPLEGRDPAVLAEVAGVLWNPMPQATASLLTLASCAAWFAGQDPARAWEEEVDRRGLRELVEGVTGRVPDDPTLLRDRLGAIAAATAPGLEDEVGPWLEAAQAEARLGLAALDVLDLCEAGDPDAWALTVGVLRLASWGEVRRAPVSVFGGRLAIRPVVDQDPSGRFRVRPGVVEERSTVVDELVRAALRAAGAATT